jgi:hypothetical protein
MQLFGNSKSHDINIISSEYDDEYQTEERDIKMITKDNCLNFIVWGSNQFG